MEADDDDCGGGMRVGFQAKIVWGLASFVIASFGTLSCSLFARGIRIMILSLRAHARGVTVRKQDGHSRTQDRTN